MSLGALGDSFYEYLLKYWIYKGGRTKNDPRGREAFDDAMRVRLVPTIVLPNPDPHPDPSPTSIPPPPTSRRSARS